MEDTQFINVTWVPKYDLPGDQCRVIQVIETTLLRRGSGKDENDPVRCIRQYYTLEGRLIAEVDPCPTTPKESPK